MEASNEINHDQASELWSPVDSAIVTMSDDDLVKVDLTEQAESGDWVLYVHYNFDTNGLLTSIESVLNILNDNVQVKKQFQVKQGKALVTKTELFDLTTLKQTTKPRDFEDVDVPIYLEAKGLPFFKLLPLK